MDDAHDSLEDEHARLLANQKQLLEDHKYLEAHPHDVAGHLDHSRKLRAHIEALHGYVERLRVHRLSMAPRDR